MTWSIGAILLSIVPARPDRISGGAPGELAFSIGTAVGSRHRIKTFHIKIDLWPRLCYVLRCTKENRRCGTRPRERTKAPLPPFGRRQRDPRARRRETSVPPEPA